VLKLVKDSIKICGKRHTWSIWRKPALLKIISVFFITSTIFTVMKFGTAVTFGVAVGVSLQNVSIQILII
jgi:hypothetical protein